jgi:hypothetical protein
MDLEFLFAIDPESAFSSLEVQLGDKVYLKKQNLLQIDYKSNFEGKRSSKERV